MNLQWKRFILTAALPLGMAVMAPAQAAFIVDDFNTTNFYDCEDPTGAGDFCAPNNTPIDPGNIVWDSDAPHTNITRTIDANLLSGDRVATEICNSCQAAHLVADAGVTPSVGEYWFVWTGDSVNLFDPNNPTFLSFDWGADLAGTTWFADINGVDSSVQAALPATPGPGFLTHEASIDLTAAGFGAAALSAVTQISLHFNGVGALDANIDNVNVSVPEPSILALLSVSLLGLGWVRRRRAG